MPRVLGEEINSVKFSDNLSGSELEVYYRQPTTEERAAYSNESVQRKRNKVLFRAVQARQKFGLKILTGIREGDFLIKKEGKTMPIASDPASPNFDPNWKTLIMTHAADVVELLALHVFDASVETLDETQDSPEGEGVDRD